MKVKFLFIVLLLFSFVTALSLSDRNIIPVSASVTHNPPEIKFFGAQVLTPDTVLISWKSINETNILWYDIERAYPDFPYSLIKQGIKPIFKGLPKGASYLLTDSVISGHTYRYQLDVVKLINGIIVKDYTSPVEVVIP